MVKKGKVVIDREVCKGCFLCIRACHYGLLEQDTQPNALGIYPSKVVYESKGEKCIACGNCFQVCPDMCITIYEEADV
ncbi:MAG: 4Fe-4S dicluster domain-containing protein [Treponema sp.]|jgi:2-oxoglutarate ferredoxin oxidoreductase subunit delta|nr:4Fe-4S dicluster domain-containing protein [Treponema sp.]